jgi:hypothetical protein
VSLPGRALAGRAEPGTKRDADRPIRRGPGDVGRDPDCDRRLSALEPEHLVGDLRPFTVLALPGWRRTRRSPAIEAAWPGRQPRVHLSREQSSTTTRRSLRATMKMSDEDRAHRRCGAPGTEGLVARPLLEGDQSNVRVIRLAAGCALSTVTILMVMCAAIDTNTLRSRQAIHVMGRKPRMIAGYRHGEKMW